MNPYHVQIRILEYIHHGIQVFWYLVVAKKALGLLFECQNRVRPTPPFMLLP